MADLSADEIGAIHQAYLQRIPKRDVRQNIDLTLGKYHWLSLFVDFGPLAAVKNKHFLEVLSSNIEHGVIIDKDNDIWVDDEDFRAYTVLFHEFIHLQ